MNENAREDLIMFLESMGMGPDPDDEDIKELKKLVRQLLELWEEDK